MAIRELFSLTDFRLLAAGICLLIVLGVVAGGALRVTVRFYDDFARGWSSELIGSGLRMPKVLAAVSGALWIVAVLLSSSAVIHRMPGLLWAGFCAALNMGLLALFALDVAASRVESLAKTLNVGHWALRTLDLTMLVGCLLCAAAALPGIAAGSRSIVSWSDWL